MRRPVSRDLARTALARDLASAPRRSRRPRALAVALKVRCLRRRGVALLRPLRRSERIRASRAMRQSPRLPQELLEYIVERIDKLEAVGPSWTVRAY